MSGRSETPEDTFSHGVAQMICINGLFSFEWGADKAVI